MPGQKDVLFNKKSFVLKLFHGIVTSLLLYFIPYGVFNRATTPNGIDLGDTEFFSTVVACCLVVTVNLQVCVLSGMHSLRHLISLFNNLHSYLSSDPHIVPLLHSF